MICLNIADEFVCLHFNFQNGLTAFDINGHHQVSEELKQHTTQETKTEITEVSLHCRSKAMSRHITVQYVTLHIYSIWDSISSKVACTFTGFFMY